MTDEQWMIFFETCIRVLGSGGEAEKNRTRCAWTTFCMLEGDLTYWVSRFPDIEDLSHTGIGDGGVWGQPFPYSEIAHIIIPRKFRWYGKPGPQYVEGYTLQDIDMLSNELSKLSVPHHKSDKVLQIMLY